MKKRIVSILLCLCIVISMVPAQASAATITPEKPQGSGTAADPYKIGTTAQLYWFAGVVNGKLQDGTPQNESACAVLTANITVNAAVLTKSGDLISDTSGLIPWTPISGNTTTYQCPIYKGVFDGGNYAISGLYFNDGRNYVGIFGYCQGATIKNLKIVDSYINGWEYVGGICGTCSGGTTISNCTNDAIVSANNYAGGICGNSYKSTIEKCKNIKNVYARDKVSRNFCGGICGCNETATISNCLNGGAVSATDFAGGICGTNYNNSSITNCYNYGVVEKTSESGAVAGINSETGTTISNCYYDTNVSVSDGIGYDYSKRASVTGKTPAAFASGEVCYLLNQGITDGTQVWYQNIDNGKTLDAYPQYSGGTVYPNFASYSNVAKQPTSIVFKNTYQPSKTYDGTPLLNPENSDLIITGGPECDVTFTWYKNSVSEENKLSSAPKDVGSYVVKASIYAVKTTSNSFTITAKSVNSPTLELSQTSYVFDHQEKKPLVTVMDGNTIIPSEEYTVSYSDNINPGTATISIQDKEGGNYIIENASTTFQITIDPSNILVSTIVGGIIKTYDGKAFELSTTKGTHVTWDGTGTATISGYYIDSQGNTPTNNANSGAAGEGAAPVKEGIYYAKVFVTTEDGATSPSFYIPFTIMNKDNIPFSGAGTKAEPYNINTEQDLDSLANLVKNGKNFSGKYFILNNNIDYASVPVGCYDEANNLKYPFCGNFNGGGHTVNLVLTNNGANVSMAVALFGYLGKGASVENIETTGMVMSTGKYSGGIAGYAGDGEVNISNCSSNVEMTYIDASKYPDCTYGGIVGLIDKSGSVSMTNCCFTGGMKTFVGNSLEGLGGLCGWNSGTLTAKNCYVDSRFASGITSKGKYLARNGGSFTNCYYNADNKLTDDNPTNVTGTKAVTADFSSGKIAWLLQNGQSDSTALVWVQALSGVTKNSDPVLLSDPAKAGLKVNKITFEAGTGLESGLPEGVSTDLYANNSMTFPTFSLTEEEKTQGYQYNFQIKSGTATLDTTQNQLKDIIEDVTITVTLTKEIRYTVTAQTVNSTMGSVVGGGAYAAGTSVTLTAVPMQGYKFVHWTSDLEGKQEVSKEKTLTITVSNASTYYAWFEQDSYKLTVVNSTGGTVTGLKEEGYSAYEEATLIAYANEGYTFDGWKNEYSVTISTGSAISFRVSGNMTIIPVFTHTDENVIYYIAAFYHQSGNLLKSERVARNGTITPPITPTKAGYDFIGWSTDGIHPVGMNPDGSITITSNIIFKPLFQANEDKYSLTVNGAVQGTYQPLSSVTVQVAPAVIPEGKKFAYWADLAGNAVSYSNPYNFIITGNIVLTAVYEDAIKDVIKKPTLTLNAPLYEAVSAGKHKMIWYASMDLPEGYTLVESGILRVVANTPQTKEEMTFETAGIYRRSIQVPASINQYYYSVSTQDGKGISLRAYVVVRNPDGNYETIFSDVQYGCYQ